MSSPYRDPRIGLPDHWPRGVRSAVVHAVSMANVAFTATQVRAANHFNPRNRLQATNDRLQRQVALLLEELPPLFSRQGFGGALHKFEFPGGLAPQA